MLSMKLEMPKCLPREKEVKFADFFAGIGGFHLGLYQLGMKCVLACEIDKYARQTYQENLSKVSPYIFPEFFKENILNLNLEEIPDFDILCAGFPCQPFSQAGKKRGFQESKASRGNMFFEIMRIANEKRPKVLFLENVRNIVKHDNGETFWTIQKTVKELGYSFTWKIIKASEHGLPQHRPRVYMVCFRNDLNIESFEFPESRPLQFTMSDVFKGKCNKQVGYTLRVGGRSSGLNDRRNWDTYLVDGEETKIGTKEGLQMLGFPEDFVFSVSNNQAMKQLGNSIAINVVRDIGFEILKALKPFEKGQDEV